MTRLLAVALCAGVACAPSPLTDEIGIVSGSDDATLATVADRGLRFSHFEAERVLSERQLKGAFRSDTKKSDLVQSIIDREVLFCEGWARETIRSRADVDRAVKRALARARVKDELGRVGSQEVVPENELRERYGARRAEWRQPPRVQVRTILRRMMGSEIAAKRREQRRVLERIRDGVRQGTLVFAEAAKKESEDVETAGVGGDMGWFDLGSSTMPEAARKLTTDGAVSEVVEVADGYRLYAVTQVVESGHLPFDAVREKIREEVLFNRVRDRLVHALSVVGSPR